MNYVTIYYYYQVTPSNTHHPPLALWWCGVDVGIIYIYNHPVGNPKRRL
jgi:hypothetical protein